MTLGDIAGYIDIGLNTWSLLNSVDRMLNAKDKFDRYDAIADVVGDAVNLAALVVLAKLSLAMPPLAPMFFAVGVLVHFVTGFYVNLFKNINVVNRINAEIPLLDHEKGYVFGSRFFDWFGTRKPDYIDNMLEEKQANDLAVQHNLKFLEQNDAFLGIVFPSRTLYYDGGCRLTKRYCGLKNAWGCTLWYSERETVGSGCEWRRSCGSYGICDDGFKRVGAWGYDDFECKCDNSPKNTFGYPRSDSVVDFRSTKTVYWERSVPAEVENAVFYCKPGTLSYIDEKMSQGSSRQEYYCKHAIGLLQPSWRRKPGQTMLFDLDDGTDTVHAAEESTPNLFRMGKAGNKEFHGGWGQNLYVFDSDCSGYLYGSIYGGGTASDVVSFGDKCGRGQKIVVDFINGRVSGAGGKLGVNIYDIEEVNGRQGEGETVLVSCSTKRVQLAGGSTTFKDEVVIREDSTCAYNLTVVVGGHTDITSNAVKGTINIPIGDFWGRSVVNLMLYQELKISLIFTKTASSKLTGSAWNWNGNQLKLSLESYSGQIEFNLNMTEGVHDTFFHFTEEPQGMPYSLLYLSKERDPICYHPLKDIANLNSMARTGCKPIGNMFDITGSGWQVTGGDKADEFVLHRPEVSGVDGGHGEDTLRLHENFRDNLEIDLNSKFRNVENVHGVSGIPLSVRCACGTKLVSPQGGSQNAPDVTIIEGSCSERNVQVVAQGHSRVVVEDGAGFNSGDMVKFLAVQGKGNDVVRFQLETKGSVKSVMVAIVTAHRQLNVTESARIGEFVNVEISGEGSEWVKLNLKETAGSTEAYLKMPYIQLSLNDKEGAAGQLIIERETVTPRVLFDLRDEDSPTVKGYQGISNMFRFGDTKSWQLTGGDLNDVFTLLTEADTPSAISIDGGEGEDTLHIDKDSSSSQTSPIVINLAKEEFGVSGPRSSNLRGKITSIEHVVGRASAPDIIHTACTTKSVNGRGGSGPGTGKDLLIIPYQSCSQKVALNVGRYSNVRSQATQGQFIYNVEDLLTTNLELRATKSNLHQLKFLFHPWNVIKAIAWDDKTKSLGWKLGSTEGREEPVQAFQMAQRDDHSGEFDNPVFEFHPEGSEVISDIRVSLDGVTKATYMIRGGNEHIKGLPVDVNQFLINVTGDSQPSSEWSIRGCGDSKRCSANQFWIFKLDSSLALLDGGDCAGTEESEEESGGCKNHLHLQEGFHSDGHVWIDLSPGGGSMTSSSGIRLISSFQNIHELHGSRGISAFVSCESVPVSNVDMVTIEAADCPLDLIIGLEEWTRVWFEEDNRISNVSFDMRTELLAVSNVHYRFSRPMSFDPEGSLHEMLMHSHNYYLSFTLDELDSLDFDLEIDRLAGETFHHTMLASAGYNEQFYSQPEMVTKDGYKLEVARDGSLWATLGETIDISPDSIPHLQSTANRLRVTMILQTSKEFYYIGYPGEEGDRTVLQNVAATRSHLCGGGGVNTIYEVLHLDTDVYIYTGLEEGTFDIEDVSGVKQTIDLTNVVVPIRLQSGTKYVPKLEKIGDDLVITMSGYEEENPGKLVIVNGTFPWVARRVQLLLNNAVMDLQPVLTARRRKRDASNADEVIETESDWAITPRPVVIPEDVTVYSISPEDLEDGQDIHLETPSTNPEQNSSSANANVQKFRVVRNGGDLYLTNIGGSINSSQTKTVVISDFFYAPQPDSSVSSDVLNNTAEYYDDGSLNVTEILLEEDFEQNLTFPRGVSLVTITLPGINLVLNDTKVASYEVGNDTAEPIQMNMEQVEQLDRVLYKVEGRLLKDIPGVERAFECEVCSEEMKSKWYEQSLFWIGGCMAVLLFFVISWWVRGGGKGRYFFGKTNAGPSQIPDTIDDEGESMVSLKSQKIYKFPLD